MSKTKRRTLLRCSLPRTVCLMLLIVLAIVGCAAGQASFKIVPAGPPPDSIPAKLRRQLQGEGTRLLHSVQGIDTPVCDLWWARDITTAQRGNAGTGVIYRHFLPGSFLGVIYLPEDIEDSFHTNLNSGFYTLRYGRVSAPMGKRDRKDDDDDDAGKSLATNVDVAVLSRLGSDTGARTVLITAALEWSKAAAGGKEAARMRLLPLNPAYKTFPALVSDDQGNCAVQFRLLMRTKSGETKPLAISILLFILPDFGAED